LYSVAESGNMNALIQNIIFDLGGVILNIDPERTRAKFIAMWNGKAEEVYRNIVRENILEDYETGRISTDEFRQALLKYAHPGTPPSAIDDAWNAMLLDIPAENLTVLWKVKEHYRTFLLSNTNAMHTPLYSAMFSNKSGKSMEEFFEGVFLSHKLGMNKPHREIFEYVLQVNGLRPDETLFIDDAEENIRAAAALGIQTIHLIPPLHLQNIFSKDGRLHN